MHHVKAADRVLADDLRKLDRRHLYFGKYGDTYRRLAEKYFSVLGGGEASEEDRILIENDVKNFEQPVSTEKLVPAENLFVYTPNQLIVKPNENMAKGQAVKRVGNLRQKVNRKPKSKAPKLRAKPMVVVKRPGPLNFPRGGVKAPVAFLPALPGENKAKFNNRSKDSFHYVGTDRILDFVPTASTLAAGDVIFNMRFTPQDFIGMPRLKILSKLWARWRMKRLHMTIVTKAPSSASGGWVAYWDPESGDNPIDIAAGDRVYVATAHKGATEGYWWGKRYDVPAPHKPDFFYTDVSSHTFELDPKWIYSHRFVMVANASAGLVTNSTMATLYLHADIEFSEPTIEAVVSPGPANQTMDLNEAAGGSVSSVIQLGTAPTRTSGSMPDLHFVGGVYIEQVTGKAAYNSTGGSYFLPPPGRWFVYLEMTAGASMTTSTWTIGSATVGSIINQSHLVNSGGTKLITVCVADFADTRGLVWGKSDALSYGSISVTPATSLLRLINISTQLTAKKQDSHMVTVMKRLLEEMGVAVPVQFPRKPHIEVLKDDEKSNGLTSFMVEEPSSDDEKHLGKSVKIEKPKPFGRPIVAPSRAGL